MKDEQLLIKLTEDEKNAFKKAADLNGMSLSAWVRHRLRIASAKELQEVGKEVDFLKDAK